jgi:hypothetical protein
MVPALAHAGLHYSGEPMAELPSQWRGFLLDQQSLRMIAAKPKPGDAVHPLRGQYLKSAGELETAQRSRALTADEWADLGAVYIRLGNINKALEMLRKAQEAHPKHFTILANLGTAWQLHGDLAQATLALKQAVMLAPGKHLLAEQYHFKLVQLRLKEPADRQELDDLFGVRYEGEGGKFQPGKMAEAQKKKLPAKVAAVMQQLCLWLPNDGRLLWQLAEIANAYGDIQLAANMMDGCVVQLGMKHKELRQHREILRDAAAKLVKTGAAEGHQGHISGLPAVSARPLLTKFNEAALPPINATGTNKLPWVLLADTRLDAKGRPAFPKYLQGLDGKKVSLHGFMQPFKDSADVVNFMLIEYPVGCWFCEMPGLTGIVQVEMPKGMTAGYTRELIHVTGELMLNSTDPEEFLFTIRNAQVGGVD